MRTGCPAISPFARQKSLQRMPIRVKSMLFIGGSPRRFFCAVEIAVRGDIAHLSLEFPPALFRPVLQPTRPEPWTMLTAHSDSRNYPKVIMMKMVIAMDLRDSRLVVVAEHRNAMGSRSTESQSTCARKKFRRLEERVNAKPVKRNPKGVELTTRGWLLAMPPDSDCH
jgi:hypothetical protein